MFLRAQPWRYCSRPQFTIIDTLDPFCRTRLSGVLKIDFTDSLKFNVKKLQVQEAGGGGGGGDVYEVTVPLGECLDKKKYGPRIACGIALSVKEAEIAALMHVERILDTLGIPVYAMKSSQKKHAEKRRAMGLWAPLPDEAVGQPPVQIPSPPPLRYTPPGPPSRDATMRAPPPPSVKVVEAEAFVRRSVKHYVVVVGRDVGVFADKSLMEASVMGYPGARLATFGSEEEARKYFENPKKASLMRDKKVRYHAVAQGHQTGITMDGTEAALWINGYKKSVSSVFDTLEEAKFFLEKPSFSSLGTVHHGIASHWRSANKQNADHPLAEDETEEGYWDLVYYAESNEPFTSLVALFLPFVLDVKAHTRFLTFLQHNKLNPSKEIRDISTTPHLRVLECTLPLCPQMYGPGRVARGACPAHLGLDTAQDVLAMHAELIMDACGYPYLFTDEKLQLLHVQSVVRCGRWATTDKMHGRPHAVTPKPLRLSRRSRPASLSIPEKFLVMKEDVVGGDVDTQAASVFAQYVREVAVGNQAAFKFDEDPSVHFLMLLDAHAQELYRYMVPIPMRRTPSSLPSSSSSSSLLLLAAAAAGDAEVVYGIGTSTKKKQAFNLACMHACEILRVYGCTRSNAWIPMRSRDHHSIRPHPFTLPRASITAENLKEVPPAQELLNTPHAQKRSFLSPPTVTMTEDGYIFTQEHKGREKDLLAQHTLFSPGLLCFEARARMEKLAPELGLGRFWAQMSHVGLCFPNPKKRHKLTVAHAYRATWKIGETGLVAIGEAARPTEAVHCCAMHAELLLDAAGQRIFTNPSQQAQHAATAISYGRWAPGGSAQPDPPPHQPRPPPLRFQSVFPWGPVYDRLMKVIVHSFERGDHNDALFEEIPRDDAHSLLFHNFLTYLKESHPNFELTPIQRPPTFPLGGKDLDHVAHAWFPLPDGTLRLVSSLGNQNILRLGFAVQAERIMTGSAKKGPVKLLHSGPLPDHCLSSAGRHPKKFFGVARGHKVAVVTTLNEANELTEGYKHFKRRSFDTYEEALAYIQDPWHKQELEIILAGEKKTSATEEGKEPKWFYAVSRGFTKGIFLTAEAQHRATEGYPDSLQATFSSREEAEAWMHKTMVATKKKKKKGLKKFWVVMSGTPKQVEALVTDSSAEVLKLMERKPLSELRVFTRPEDAQKFAEVVNTGQRNASATREEEERLGQEEEGKMVVHPIPPSWKPETSLASWHSYIAECESFMAAKKVLREIECYALGVLPPMGCPVCDMASTRMTSEPDISAKTNIFNFCTRKGHAYPVGRTATVHRRFKLCQFSVPGHSHYTARGVGSTASEAERRAAMHCIEILRLVEPEFLKWMYKSKPTAGDHTTTLTALQISGAVIQKLLELYCTLLDLPPVKYKVPAKDERRHGNVTVTVVLSISRERKFSTTGTHSDVRSAKEEASEALFKQLYSEVPAFQAVLEIMQTHTQLRPEHVVRLKIPEELEDMFDFEDEDEEVEKEERQWQTSTSRKHRESKLVLPLRIQEDTLNTALPIYSVRKALLNAIQSNPVTILCGTTGCGKTTQIAQYILADHPTAHILITQPRRISAVSIAARVGKEIGVPGAVGHIVRFDPQPGSHVTFCTTGIVLRRFVEDPFLEGVTHVVLDEVHERDINTDFLLVLMKRLVAQTRPDLRVVVMSATLRADIFSTYFHGAPVVSVEGGMYPVKIFHLDQIVPLAQSAGVSTTSVVAMQKGTRGPLEAGSPIDFALLTFLLRHILAYNDVLGHAVLVFLPGIGEIRQAMSNAVTIPKYLPLILHSTVSATEQLRCFEACPRDRSKLILSTNIAESAVTIPDVKVVIDVGRMKELLSLTQFGKTKVGQSQRASTSHLAQALASKANCVQRLGRAGRTQGGTCYRMFTEADFQTFEDYSTPEILRSPLDSLCLQILAMGHSPEEFFAQALDAPKREDVELAMQRLRSLSAVHAERDEITSLGQVLGAFPVAPSLARMILLGSVLGVLDTALTLASLKEVPSIFKLGHEAADRRKLTLDVLGGETLSDHLAQVNAYNLWHSFATVYPTTPTSSQELEDFLTEHDLSEKALKIVSRTKRQFYGILCEVGFVERSSAYHQSEGIETAFRDTSSYSRFCDNEKLVKGLLCAGLMPNFALHSATVGKSLWSSRSDYRTKLEPSVRVSSQSIVSSIAPKKQEGLAGTSPFVVFTAQVLQDHIHVPVLAEVTVIGLWEIVLLGVPVDGMRFREDLNLCVVDDWVMVSMDVGTYERIVLLKQTIFDGMMKKAQDRGLTVSHQANESRLAHAAALMNRLIRSPVVALSVDEGEKPWVAPSHISQQIKEKDATQEAMLSVEGSDLSMEGDFLW